MPTAPWMHVARTGAVLAAAMGIGRFVYTPILPLMTAQAGLSPQTAGHLATANYIGYLVGAVAGAFSPRLSRSMSACRVSLIVLVVSLAAMPLTDNAVGWMVLRLAAGVASALVFVIAINTVLDHLHGHPAHLPGWAFRVRPDGGITCLLDNVPSPNGIVLNADETALYVAATRGNCIWHVPFLRNGGVGKVGLFVQLSGAGGPDGLALDEQGRLVIAHVRLGCAWVVDRFGEPVYRINSCAGRMITNMAYGWPDRSTLYITESETGTILKAELDVPGKLMDSHR